MVEEVAKSAKFVSMGCKLPNGLRMRVFKSYEESEPVMGGGSRSVTRWRQDGESFILNGNRYQVNETGAQNVSHVIEGGFGITNNVPAEFAQRFIKQNEDAAIVKEGLVFIMGNETEARAKAKDGAKKTSGLEPLDPTFTLREDGVLVPNDPRIPKGTATGAQKSGVTAIHTGLRE